MRRNPEQFSALSAEEILNKLGTFLIQIGAHGGKLISMEFQSKSGDNEESVAIRRAHS